jgi:UDP-N-acetylmuramate dehydrogenase
VGGSARYFVAVRSEKEIKEAVAFAEAHGLPVVVLGGGSNVLVSDAGVDAVVMHMQLQGIEHAVEGDTVMLTVQAGEMLDDVVAHAVEKEWWGLENLSHIPGTVGATPVQNVGAYGVEVKDRIASVRVIDMHTGATVELSNDACAFAYRNSLFKREEGKRYIITAVTFALSLEPSPCLSYKDLALAFEGRTPTIQEIRDAVIQIRSGKFPNWHMVGTAGSFFKNPMIAADIYERLHTAHPDVPAYRTDEGMMKVSLGWILDKALGLRGYTEGSVGLYEKQALVLIAQKGATQTEITRFADGVIARVREAIGIDIECEVTMIS